MFQRFQRLRERNAGGNEHVKLAREHGEAFEALAAADAARAAPECAAWPRGFVNFCYEEPLAAKLFDRICTIAGIDRVSHELA